jgi:hypothetical protein
MVTESQSFRLFNGCRITVKLYQEHVPPVEKGYIRAAQGQGWILDLTSEPEVLDNGHPPEQPRNVL